MAETVGKISLQRRGTFYDSSAPRSFTVKSEQNSFITGQGGNLFDVYEALRCKTRGNNRRGVATCPNPCSEWWRCYLWGRVNDSTWRRFRWQLLKKKWDGRGDFVGFVGDSVESLLYYYYNYLKTFLYSSL